MLMVPFIILHFQKIELKVIQYRHIIVAFTVLVEFKKKCKNTCQMSFAFLIFFWCARHFIIALVIMPILGFTFILF